MQTKNRILVYAIVIMGMFFILSNACKKKDEPDPVPGPVATLTTTEVTNVILNTAKSGGTISSDGGVAITEKGVCWSTGQTPTIADSKTSDGTGTGAYTSIVKGLLPATTYYLRAYATTSNGTAYGSAVSFTTMLNKVTDLDGNVYTTVEIGNQIWMAENLKTTQFNDTTAIPLVTDNGFWSILGTPGYCWYNNDPANKTAYGAIYNWYAASSGKLAPIGWHIATDAEWTVMENYLSANGYNWDGTTSGNKLAKALGATTGWAQSPVEGSVGNTDYPTKRNLTGFSALPGGFRNQSGAFSNLGSWGYWWCSSESSVSFGINRNIAYFGCSLQKESPNKNLGYSIRCVKD